MTKFERPKHIYYTGRESGTFLYGVPMKDELDLEGEEAWLDDGEVERALVSKLYQKTKPTAVEMKAETKMATKTVTKNKSTPKPAPAATKGKPTPTSSTTTPTTTPAVPATDSTATSAPERVPVGEGVSNASV